MQTLLLRLSKYYKNRRDYLFSPVDQIFDYDSATALSEIKDKRILDELNPADYNNNLILTTYFCSKPDPQRKIVIENDNFQYIQEFYDSVVEHNLHAVIFYDNLSDEFITKYTCPNVKFVKTRIIKYSLNDERFFIYREFLKRIEAEKIILSDVNDVTFGKNPFEMIQQDRFYIGRDHHALVKGSEWIQNKVSLLPQNIKERIPVLFGNMPLVNAGVIGGDAHTITNFVEKVAALLAYVDNNNNNNMACVNIAFFDAYWLPYHKNTAVKLKYLRNQDIKKLTGKLQISSKKFLMGKPFTSHFWKFEKDNGSYIYHK